MKNDVNPKKNGAKGSNPEPNTSNSNASSGPEITKDSKDGVNDLNTNAADKPALESESPAITPMPEAEVNDNIVSNEEKSLKLETKDAEEKAAPEVLNTPAPAEKPWVETNPEYRPEAQALGVDEDGSPLISAIGILNKIGKKIISLFADREQSNLPKLTGTEITKMCANQGIETVYQYSDAKQSRGRVIIKAEGTYVSLPLDVNEEFNFGIDFDAMAERARAEGKEWGEKQLEEAKAEAEMDEHEKNRLSVRKLEMIGEEITKIFEERGKTNLPGVTEAEVRSFLRNHSKSIGIDVRFVNADGTLGYVVLTEFKNELHVPSQEPLFTFGIDYAAAAEKIAEDAKK